MDRVVDGIEGVQAQSSPDAEPEVPDDHAGTPAEPGPKLLNESPAGDSICCHIIPMSLALAFAIVAVPGAELVHGMPP